MAGTQKIAFLCHPYHRGGVTRWMADAAIAWSKQGLEVYFVTVDPVKEFYSAKGRETLLQLLRKEQNTVHILSERVDYEFEFGTPEYRTYIYQKLLVKLPPGTPVILSDDQVVWDAATYLHVVYPIVGVLHADEAHYYRLAEKYFRNVAVLACVSDRVSRTTLERVPQFDPKYIYTIPCGIELPAFDVAAGDTDILKLVYVGRVSNYQKRAGDLATICDRLAENNISFHLNIIGDGDAKIPLEAAVKEQGRQQYVTFCGWLSQKEVARYLRDSDILLLTSDFEGTPIAMMEALAAGCGMVGTRVSGIEDCEHHPLAADCLAVYPTGEIAEAVNAINKVAAITKTVRQAAARKLAESEFSMQVCLRKYLNAIEPIKINPVAMPAISISAIDLVRSRAIAAVRKLRVSLKG